MPKDPVDVALGRRIRARRLAARLTRKELARQLGISEDKLLNIEVCRSRLYLGDVLEIARVLGVPLTDLLGDFAPVPSLDWYFTARNPALARRAPDSIEQRIAATLWLERHFAQLYRLDCRDRCYKSAEHRFKKSPERRIECTLLIAIRRYSHATQGGLHHD